MVFGIYGLNNQSSPESKTVILGAPEVYVQVKKSSKLCLFLRIQKTILICSGIKLILICLCSLLGDKLPT